MAPQPQQNPQPTPERFQGKFRRRPSASKVEQARRVAWGKQAGAKVRAAYGELTLKGESMSEQETTRPETEPEPDDEQAEPESPEEEQAESSEKPQDDEPDADEAQGEPQPAEGEATAQGASQEEIEAAFKKLGKLDEHVARRVSEIMGDEAVNLIRCPVCTPLAPGWIYPPTIAPLEAEQVAGMKALMGIQDVADLSDHPAFQRCPDCRGKAYVKTGSLRDGYESTECPTCNGLGYKQDLRGQIVPNGSQPLPPEVVVTGPTVFAAELPPELAEYKRQGWLIAPPVQMPS